MSSNITIVMDKSGHRIQSIYCYEPTLSSPSRPKVESIGGPDR